MDDEQILFGFAETFECREIQITKHALKAVTDDFDFSQVLGVSKCPEESCGLMGLVTKGFLDVAPLMNETAYSNRAPVPFVMNPVLFFERKIES